jgi:rubrerythrin
MYINRNDILNPDNIIVVPEETGIDETPFRYINAVSVETILNAPKANVVEQKQGRWIRKDYKPCGHDYICSVCGYAVPQTYKHCPECISKMER